MFFNRFLKPFFLLSPSIPFHRHMFFRRPSVRSSHDESASSFLPLPQPFFLRLSPSSSLYRRASQQMFRFFVLARKGLPLLLFSPSFFALLNSARRRANLGRNYSPRALTIPTLLPLPPLPTPPPPFLSHSRKCELEQISWGKRAAVATSFH